VTENRFKFESLQDNETIISYLESLKQGFMDGRLSFSWRDKNMELEPKGLIRFDVEARKKGDEHKLTLRFSWTEGEQAELTSEPLRIGTGRDR